MILANAFCALWFTALIVVEPIEHAHQHRLVEASIAIEPGMTPDDVRSTLGEPTFIYKYEQRRGLASFLLGQRPKQWMYGAFLNLDYLIVPGMTFPNPFPINLRLLAFESEDLVIDWSRNNTVAYVRRPSFDVHEFADAMLDTVEFVDLVLHSIVLQPK